MDTTQTPMLEPNTLIHDRYLLQTKLGQGGIGAVYQAVDQQTNHIVVIKYQQKSTPQIDAAFEREASQIQRLEHPALPRVLDYFANDRGLFLMMEFMPGDDLSVPLLRDYRPFPLDTVLVWTEQVLALLEYLHSQDPPIIHRDIKPQNLKLKNDEQIVVLDFGLAKGSVALDELAGSTLPYYTPDYAPPEQIEGRGTDARSDLYALAATLHHLLTASTPTDALSRSEDLASGKPDPQRSAHALNRLIPTSISDVLLRTLAMNPSERPDSVAAFRAALHAAYEPHGSYPTLLPTNERTHMAKTNAAEEDPSTSATRATVSEQHTTMPDKATANAPHNELEHASSQQSNWLWPMIVGIVIALVLIGAFVLMK